MKEVILSSSTITIEKISFCGSPPKQTRKHKQNIKKNFVRSGGIAVESLICIAVLSSTLNTQGAEHI